MVSNRLAGKQYTGYPAWIFIEVESFGRGTQTHIEKLTILDKWFSHLRAYLPVAMAKKKEKTDFYNESLAPKINDVDSKLQDAWGIYDPSMESLDSCNPNEKEFILFMRGIFIDLDEITAESGIIDKESFSDEFEAG